MLIFHRERKKITTLENYYKSIYSKNAAYNIKKKINFKQKISKSTGNGNNNNNFFSFKQKYMKVAVSPSAVILITLFILYNGKYTLKYLNQWEFILINLKFTYLSIIKSMKRRNNQENVKCNFVWRNSINILPITYYNILIKLNKDFLCEHKIKTNKKNQTTQ